MLKSLVTVLFWMSVGTLAAGALWRARLWRIGRSAETAWSGLLAVPKRYFVDLHHIVTRDPYMARAHIATAGGAVAAFLLVGVNYGLAIYSQPLDLALLAAGATMLAGVFFIWLRRRAPPPRLSHGGWDRLPYTLAAFAVGLVLLTSVPADMLTGVLAAGLLALLLAGSAELALGIGAGGPMKHAVAGLLHLAWHPRPERFRGIRSTALKPLDLEGGDFGVTSLRDFRWNQLLGFDACVECGRCEAACPAFAAGQPLNPKKLIQDLVGGMSNATDAAYSGSAHPGQSPRTHRGSPCAPTVPGLVEAATLWSCTTCRACVEECPMTIEHVDAIIGLRRALTLVSGEAAGKAPHALAHLRETDTQGGYDARQRYAWAAGLGVPVAEPGVPVDILLIAGEGAFDMRYQRTLRALVAALRAAKVQFAVPGGCERDTGDAARRLGDEATFQRLARENIEWLRSLRFRRILTPDPHVLHSIKNEYPDFGGTFDVVHHTTFLAELVADGKLKLRPSSEARPLTYHDPCYLGRYNGEFDAPRALLGKLGVDLREMERSGLRARCCGGGGGAPLTDIPGKRRIPDMRMDDARSSGAKVVAVACPQCTAMLEGVAGERPEVVDIAELVAGALEKDV